MQRLFDALASAAGIVLLSPLLLAIAILVKATSPGPVIYRARRVGRGGVLFDVLKFRTMRAAAGGAGITRAGDPRVTAVGRVLRKYKLDELPQLFNVVRGEMSLVGPRPEDPRYVALYDDDQRRVLDVRPGITSAASIEYRDEESKLVGESWEETYVREIMPTKLRIDLGYLQGRTFISDLGLILKTVRAMLG
jgi:lipopolysaccharide/colanic/teichoic acid biosynthesis glycosyltransferase